MRRTLAVTFCALAAAATASGQAPPPFTTMQAQPISRVLAGVRQVAGHFGGPQAATALDEQIAAKLGPKGLSGLDLDRPVTAYVKIKPGALQQAFVVLVPITDRAGALDLLKRAGIEVEPTDADKDLYQIAIENPQVNQLLVRFHNNNAYVAAFAEPADLDPKKLPTAASLTTPNQGAWLLYTTHLDRLTAADRKTLAEANDRVGDVIGGLPFPPAARDRFVNYMKAVQRYNALQQDQGKTIIQKIDLDPKTLQFTIDYELTPMSATPLAADIAAYKPTDNRFAALVGADTVAGFVTKYPLFLPELRDGTAELMGQAKELGLAQLPPEFKSVGEEALDGLARAVKSGRLDIAAAIHGPDANGNYSAAAAVSFGDAGKLDAALHKLVAELPAGDRALVKLDVVKSDGVAVHEFTPRPGEGVRRVWGDAAKAAVALTKTGVLVAYGVDATARVKALIKATQTPIPAPALDIRVNLKRTRGFALVYGDNPVADAIPASAKDELRTLVKLSVAGGDALAVKLLADLGVIPAAGARE